MTTDRSEGGSATDSADPTEDDAEEDIDTSHLDDMDDGCGCAEVWDHLSEQRDD